MNVVRAELQPLAQAALTHLKRPDAPKASTPEETSAPANPHCAPVRHALRLSATSTSARLSDAIGDDDDDDIDDIEDPDHRPLRRRPFEDDDTERSHHQEASS